MRSTGGREHSKLVLRMTWQPESLVARRVHRVAAKCTGKNPGKAAESDMTRERYSIWRLLGSGTCIYALTGARPTAASSSGGRLRQRRWNASDVQHGGTPGMFPELVSVCLTYHLWPSRRWRSEGASGLHPSGCKWQLALRAREDMRSVAGRRRREFGVEAEPPRRKP